MYKLLIVDDESIIRESLVDTIEWNQIGVEVAGTAIDGEEAWAKIESLSPDIVLTDVNMDNMNGLELTELVRQNYPLTKVIILSGYDDFEFISKALELKVFSYIMKPVLSERLIDTVNAAISEIESETKLRGKLNLMESEIDRNRSLLTEKLLLDLVNGAIKDENELTDRKSLIEIEFGKSAYACAIVAIKDYQEIIKSDGIKKLHGILFSIKSLLASCMEGYEIWPLVGGAGSFTAIIGDSADSAEGFRAALAQRLGQLEEEVSRYLGLQMAVSVGGICGNVFDISNSYNEAALAQEYYGTESTGIVFIDEISQQGPRYHHPKKEIAALLSFLMNPAGDNPDEIVRSIMNGMEGLPKNQMRVKFLEIFGTISAKALEMGIDVYQLFTSDAFDPYAALERYRSRVEIEKWIERIVLRIKNEVVHRHDSSVKTIVTKTYDFLEKNHPNPYLSLADVSGNVYLNPSYFSRIYKKETGESYIDTLARIRVDHAKKLLKESGVKLSEICEKVGYPNARYFCAIFKKRLGLTPLEYRKM